MDGKKSNPCDYEYRYSFKKDIPKWEKEGWEYTGYAGHHAGFEPIVFIKRRIK